MAGLGRKVFTRETLGSAEVNGYLMDQAVMFFQSTSARAAAVPAPSDGMTSTLGTGRTLDRYHGPTGAWLPAQGAPVRFALVGPDNALDDSGIGVDTARGMHPVQTISQPFGVGVPFIALILASAYVELSPGALIALGARGNPNDVAVRSARGENKGTVNENRSLLAVDFINSNGDSVTYQPIFVGMAGAATPAADARLTYSLSLCFPQG